jgi:spermidine/putrescine-binding protein
MKRLSMALGALALLLTSIPATAQDKLVVSIWGGSWRDMAANIIGKKFTAETGVPVEYITGGTIDRLNKEKLAKGNPESDITFTTSHVGWLYANDGLYEQLDLAKVPNARHLVEQAKISPYHVGTWAYVYTISFSQGGSDGDLEAGSGQALHQFGRASHRRRHDLQAPPPPEKDKQNRR